MEGLIPLVYKSLKKSRSRRKYECLSSDASSPAYNIADFYVKDDHVHENYFSRGSAAEMSSRPGGLAHHRRYNSMLVDDRRAGGFALGGGAPAPAPPPPKPKQLVRFRSHRMLSCITGA